MFEILWELLKMRHRHMIWRNAVRKMVPIDLLNAGLPSNLQTVKKKNALSAKHSRTNAIKQGMSV